MVTLKHPGYTWFRVLVVSALTTVGVQAHATMDEQAITCLDNATNTATMLDCLNQEHQRLDQELNRVYVDLMRALKPDQRDSLRQAQRAWLVFRDAEFRAQDAIYDKMDGTLYLLLRISQRSAVIRDRVTQLRTLQGLMNPTRGTERSHVRAQRWVAFADSGYHGAATETGTAPSRMRGLPPDGQSRSPRIPLADATP